MEQEESGRPRIVSAAFYTMLAIGGLSLLAVAVNPAMLLQAMLYLAVAWGIRRNRAWTAYGFAMLTVGLTVALTVAAMLDPRRFAALPVWTLGAGLVFNLALVAVVFLAGRALEARYGRLGTPWPWAGLTAVSVGFFMAFAMYMMPTGSMEDTLMVGDRLAVWRLNNKAPQRGDVVVHVYPVNRKDTFVKRIVGIPGDRIQIRRKQLFVNDVAVKEPYAIHKTEYMDAYRDNFPSEPGVPLYPGAREMLANNVVNGEVVVPPGKYFVLGDNRDSSLDSRYWGFVDQADVIGKPAFVYYSEVPTVPELGEKKLALFRVRWGRFFHTVG